MSRIWFAKGLRGPIARRLQQALLQAGFCVGPADAFVDGFFGGDTETALKQLQAQRGEISVRRAESSRRNFGVEIRHP